MRKFVVRAATVLIVMGATSVSASDRRSFGLGLGALYNGLGGNIAWTTSTDMKFISVGVSGYAYSSHGDDTAIVGSVFSYH